MAAKRAPAEATPRRLGHARPWLGLVPTAATAAEPRHHRQPTSVSRRGEERDEGEETSLQLVKFTSGGKEGGSYGRKPHGT